MRIAYLSGSYIPSREANSVQVMKMCSAFSREGHDVLLIARGDSREAKLDFIEYGIEAEFSLEKVRGGERTFFDRLGYPIVAARAVRNKWPQTDLVYARHLPSLIVTVATTRSAFILELHRPPRAAELLVLKTLVRTRGFRGLVVISESLRQRMLTILGHKFETSVTTAHDGADLPPIEDVEDWTEATSSSKTHGLRVGYVGHLYRGRGIDVVGELARRIPDAEFHLVGGREPEISYWQSQFADLTNVKFHGHVRPSEVYQVQRRMHILLAPYAEVVHHAGGADNTAPWMSPLKIFEYMAAGRAIVASDLPALREVLQNDFNALLVQSDDIEAWVKAIQTLRDATLRRKLGEQAASTLANEYTWGIRARRVLSGLSGL
jgi:glycosyltransferase involved in cell wall biosynthesis